MYNDIRGNNKEILRLNAENDSLGTFTYGQILQLFLHLDIPLITLLGFTFLDGSFALINFCLIVCGLVYATNGGFVKFSFMGGWK